MIKMLIVNFLFDFFIDFFLEMVKNFYLKI
jgi:hypothetical protein